MLDSVMPLSSSMLCQIPFSCYTRFRYAWFRYAWFRYAWFQLTVMPDSRFKITCYAWFRYATFCYATFHFFCCDRFRYAQFPFLKLYLIPLCPITLCPSPLWQVPRGPNLRSEVRSPWPQRLPEWLLQLPCTCNVYQGKWDCRIRI